jgi:hypothetical protein
MTADRMDRRGALYYSLQFPDHFDPPGEAAPAGLRLLPLILAKPRQALDSPLLWLSADRGGILFAGRGRHEWREIKGDLGRFGCSNPGRISRRFSDCLLLASPRSRRDLAGPFDQYKDSFIPS